jgi:hypothetical protein
VTCTVQEPNPDRPIHSPSLYLIELTERLPGKCFAFTYSISFTAVKIQNVLMILPFIPMILVCCKMFKFGGMGLFSFHQFDFKNTIFQLS